MCQHPVGTGYTGQGTGGTCCQTGDWKYVEDVTLWSKSEDTL